MINALPIYRQRIAATSLVAAVVLVSPVAVRAQAADASSDGRDFRGAVATSAANALLSGTVAALVAASSKRPMRGAFWKGALGGSLQSVGKISAGYGLGVVARQIGNVGASVTSNALRDRHPLECIEFPIAVLRLHLRDCDTRPVVTVDLPTLAGAIAMIADGARFDGQSSLRTGALVFSAKAQDHPAIGGWALAGSLMYVRSEGSAIEHRRMRHELVHVIQYDALQTVISDPVEARLNAVLGPRFLRVMFRHIDLGLYVPAGLLLERTPLNPRQLLESEARVLDGG